MSLLLLLHGADAAAPTGRIFKLAGDGGGLAGLHKGLAGISKEHKPDKRKGILLTHNEDSE